MYYVYIIRSKATNRFYIGQTNNIKRRTKQHTDLKTNFAKRNKDIALEYSKAVNSLAEARKVESFLKRQKSHKFIEKVIENNFIPR